MSQNSVSGLKAAFDRSYGMLQQFIEVCPDDIWKKKFGGWPIWQQLYHGIGAVNFFILPPGAAFPEMPFPQNVGSLEVTPDTPADKAVLKACAVQLKTAADAYFASLTDEMLGEKNEGLSQRLNIPMTHATTAAMLTGHSLYHLGACDAALREQGLKGVF